jgi:hypothetical protein
VYSKYTQRTHKVHTKYTVKEVDADKLNPADHDGRSAGREK